MLPTGGVLLVYSVGQRGNVLPSVTLTEGKKLAALKFWEHLIELLEEPVQVLSRVLQTTVIGLGVLCIGESRPDRIVNIENAVLCCPAVGIRSNKRMAILIHVSDKGAIFL